MGDQRLISSGIVLLYDASRRIISTLLLVLILFLILMGYSWQPPLVAAKLQNSSEGAVAQSDRRPDPARLLTTLKLNDYRSRTILTANETTGGDKSAMVPLSATIDVAAEPAAVQTCGARGITRCDRRRDNPARAPPTHLPV